MAADNLRNLTQDAEPNRSPRSVLRRMKRFVVVSAVVGLCVPIWWGVLGFLAFTAPQSATADMFWDMIRVTCPPWLIPNSSYAGLIVTPLLLNAALYGIAACASAIIWRGVRLLFHGTLGSGAHWRLPIVVCGALGWIMAIPPIFMSGGAPWPVVLMPIGAWITIVAIIAWFSITPRGWPNSQAPTE